MKNQDTSERGESRGSIIKSVRTLLGFFALALLVVEGLFGYIFSLSGEGVNRTLIIIGMVVIIVLILAIVAVLSYLRPETVLNQSANLNIGPNPSVTSNKETNIEGVYLAEGNIHYEITITRLTGDYYKLYNPAWDGVGFFDGECYYGSFKYNAKATPPTLRGNFGVHRARLIREGPDKGSFLLFGIELKEKDKVGEFNDKVVGWVKKAVGS